MYRHEPKNCFASYPVILPRLQQDGQRLVNDSIEPPVRPGAQERGRWTPEDL